MKNKCKWIGLVIGGLILITVILNANVIYDNALVLISNQLLSEMSKEVGDDIIDINWGEYLDYQIHYKGNNIYLEYRTENGFMEILTGVYKYKIEKDNFYILSLDGDAVVSRSGDAIIYLKDSKKQLESAKITYISSKNNFNEKHQKIFAYIEDKIVFKNGI